MTDSTHVPVLVVNAFTDTLFGGNPAAVVETDTPLADGTMQSIAEQHNLSETAFLVRKASTIFTYAGLLRRKRSRFVVMPRWRLPMPWIISDTGQASASPLIPQAGRFT